MGDGTPELWMTSNIKGHLVADTSSMYESLQIEGVSAEPPLYYSVSVVPSPISPGLDCIQSSVLIS